MLCLDEPTDAERLWEGGLVAGDSESGAGRDIQRIEERDAVHPLPPQGEGDFSASHDHALCASGGQASYGSRQYVAVRNSALYVTVATALDPSRSALTLP